MFYKRTVSVLLALSLVLTLGLAGCKKGVPVDADGIPLEMNEDGEYVDITATGEEEALVEEVITEEDLEPEQDGTLLRIKKSGLTQMVSGYKAEYDGVPFTILGWKNHKGKYTFILDVDFKAKEKLGVTLDTSAATKVNFYELKHKEKNGIFEIDLKQIKKKDIDAYIEIVMQ